MCSAYRRASLYFNTPRHVKDAAIRRHRIRRDEIHRRRRGRRNCAVRLRNKFRRDSGIDYRPGRRIIISTGAKQVMFKRHARHVEPGAMRRSFRPHAGSATPTSFALAGGKPVFVPCGQNHGFKLRADDLAAAITPRTRWFILNNPCNPTGAAYTVADLRPLMRRAAGVNPDVWVLTDDIYEKISYDENTCDDSCRWNRGLKDRTVTMNGVLEGLRDDRLGASASRAHRCR